MYRTDQVRKKRNKILGMIMRTYCEKFYAAIFENLNKMKNFPEGTKTN